MTTRQELLANLTIFKGLQPDELDGLSHIAHEYEYSDGAILAFQRDLADNMVLVTEGRLFSQSVDDHGRTRGSRSLLPGDQFGAKWLFKPGAYEATVRGVGSGRVIIIKSADFIQFLKAYPNALDHLRPVYDDFGEKIIQGLPEDDWAEASKLSLSEKRERIGVITLLPDEQLEYYSRRSRYFLLIRIWWSVLGLVLTPLVVFLIVPETADAWGYVEGVLAVLAFAGFGFIALFRYLDWRNDYFVITNKHISAREFDLRSFRTELIKIPISQVQSVEILKPNLTSNVFNIGTARITTASARGTVFFDNIDDPLEVKNTLDRLRSIVKSVESGMTQTKMRRSLESYFKLSPGYKRVDDPEQPSLGTEYYERRSWPGRGLWRWTRSRFRWREEYGGVITYRKNYFVLLRDVMWPLIVMAGLLAGALILARFTTLGPWVSLLIIMPFVLIDLFWVVYGLEDWRNDTYQLTDQFVLDIDRKPFGFGESRKQAPLSNIQNVNAERPGFFATIFNYGNVTIETAGADANLVFESVPEPGVVQSDIFNRLDAFRQNQRLREGASRREEYAVLLDVYKQELEQNRIPRRTPPEEEIIEEL